MKKRILFSHLKGIVDGGSDQCLFSLLLNIDRDKYEPILLYKNENYFIEQLKNEAIEVVKIKGEKLNAIVKSTSKKNKNNKKKSLLRIYFSSIKLLIKEIPDVLYFISIVKKLNIHIVHTNHNLHGDRAIILASIFLRKKIVSHYRGLYNPVAIDRYIAKLTNKIICVSEFSKEVYVKHKIPDSKCTIIYDGVDLQKFDSEMNNTSPKIVGCFSRLEEWKGQQVLIEAASSIIDKHPDIKFMIAGNGNNKDHLIEIVKKKGIEKYFDFVGAVKNVQNYMNMCSIIVHTSIEPEPFGMVIIEAMALKKPVIATNIGGPKEIINNLEDGYLVEPNNPSKLSEIIIQLLSSDELRKKIGIDARKKVESKFNIKVTTKNIEKIFESI